jgi:hypothetical protein
MLTHRAAFGDVGQRSRTARTDGPGSRVRLADEIHPTSSQERPRSGIQRDHCFVRVGLVASAHNDLLLRCRRVQPLDDLGRRAPTHQS